MTKDNTRWTQSVAGVCIKDGKVLLVRLTYGKGKGKLIIHDGYVEDGETPKEALKREFFEETGIAVESGDLIGIRFNARDWYAVFTVEYVSGSARSDNDENSEVLRVQLEEVPERNDVPELSKIMVQKALTEPKFELISYAGDNSPNSLYAIK